MRAHAAAWFKLVWPFGLSAYMVLFLASRVPPTPETYSIYFATVRPNPRNPNQNHDDHAPHQFARFFRWVLGSHVNYVRADAAVRMQQERSAD